MHSIRAAAFHISKEIAINSKMSEVNPIMIYLKSSSNLIWSQQAAQTKIETKEQTENGDYEFVEYHRFSGVPYDRVMSWKKTVGGFVARETDKLHVELADKDMESEVLPAEKSIIVSRVTFKLVRKV